MYFGCFTSVCNVLANYNFFPDDPYYCGLRARIPNFAKSKAQRDRETSRMPSQPPQQQPQMNPAVHHPMAAWHPGPRGYYNLDFMAVL